MMNMIGEDLYTSYRRQMFFTILMITSLYLRQCLRQPLHALSLVHVIQEVSAI